MDNTTTNTTPDLTVDNNSTSNETTYRGASIALEIARDEYTKERERSNHLDNKANLFISATNAIFALYIPIIPFSGIKMVYAKGGTLQITLVTICICVLVIAFISLIISFYNLYTSFSVKPFSRVDFDALNNDEVLLQNQNVVERGLLEHYHTILTDNTKINHDKAVRLTQGLKYGILFFALMSLAILGLKIIIS